MLSIFTYVLLLYLLSELVLYSIKENIFFFSFDILDGEARRRNAFKSTSTFVSKILHFQTSSLIFQPVHYQPFQ